MELKVGDPIRITWNSPYTFSEHFLEGRVLAHFDGGQVISVKHFDGRRQKGFNLITVDHHGVPVPSLHLAELEKRSRRSEREGVENGDY